MVEAMRTTLLAMLALHGLMTAKAQVWCPPSAVWHYGSFLGFTPGYIRMEVGGDTVVLGQPCSIIAKSRTEYDYDLQQPVTYPAGIELTYSVNGLVMLYVPETNAFDTLFDLNAVPGDSWLFAARQAYHCYPESRTIVTDTGTMDIQGEALRWLAVDNVNVSDFGTTIIPDTIVERIGPIGEYLLPHNWCNGQIDGSEGAGFRCYEDDDVFYQAPYFTTCEVPLSIDPRSLAGQLGISPNPGAEQVRISWASETSYTVRIRNARGQLVREAKAVVNGQEVDLTELPAGLYAITAAAVGGRQVTSNWIKL